MHEVITALIEGAAECKSSAGDAPTRAAYEALKSALRERFGPKVRLLQAISALEENPTDEQAQENLGDAVSRALMGKTPGEHLSALAAALLETTKGRQGVTRSGVIEKNDAAPKPDVVEGGVSEGAAERVAQDTRLRPMPAPQTIKQAKRRFILLAIVMVAALIAAIALAVKHLMEPVPVKTKKSSTMLVVPLDDRVA